MNEYSDKRISDIISRSICNLRFIEQARMSDADVYETTQLLNSLAGLILFPVEEYNGALNCMEEEPLPECGFLPLEIYGEQVHSVGMLLRKLRNAIAHFNFEFETEQGELVGLYLWTQPPAQAVDWIAYISFETLRELVDFLATQLSEISISATPSSRIDRLEEKLGRCLRIRSCHYRTL